MAVAQYFECRISQNALLQTVFFGDSAHWVRTVTYYFCGKPSII